MPTSNSESELPMNARGRLASALGATIFALTTAAACVSQPTVKGDGTLDWAVGDPNEGARLFRAVCSGCHGSDGRAEVAVKKSLFPRPRDLTQGVYRFRTTASGTLPMREDILRTLDKGLPGTAMPSWGEQLNQRQLMSLVLYLETLAPSMRDEDLMPEEDDILVNREELKVPKVSPKLLARGKEVYKELKCWECHGETGRADGPSTPTLRNEDGTRAHAFDFSYGVYKGGSAPIDVYRTFMTGLDGTPMPQYADSLTEEEDRWALVYYCLSLNRERGLWFYLSERPTWQDPSVQP